MEQSSRILQCCKVCTDLSWLGLNRKCWHICHKQPSQNYLDARTPKEQASEPTSTTTSSQDWEEELSKFRTDFFNFFSFNGQDKHHYFWSDLDSFIRSKIAKARAEEREKLKEEIKGMGLKCTCGCNFVGACLCKERKDGFEKAKKRMIDKL